jgi:FlaA1/EpsC-like NDP-sugar epimerase
MLLLFTKTFAQLAHEWRLTMNHLMVILWFMSLSEAVEFSLYAMKISQSGETMSIEMKQP